MATKKNKKKTPTGRKKAVSRKAAPKNKPAAKKKSIGENAFSKKTAVRRKPRRVRGKRQSANAAVFEPKGLGARSGGQSGDLQGLSNTEGADLESVGELLEEGNAFEAGVVKGVEDAGDDGAVFTHEVPADEVPEEYRDKDR
jgi:hypothetical protein